jgi:hypothetical protein
MINEGGIRDESQRIAKDGSGYHHDLGYHYDTFNQQRLYRGWWDAGDFHSPVGSQYSIDSKYSGDPHYPRSYKFKGRL